MKALICKAFQQRQGQQLSLNAEMLLAEPLSLSLHVETIANPRLFKKDYYKSELFGLLIDFPRQLVVQTLVGAEVHNELSFWIIFAKSLRFTGCRNDITIVLGSGLR